MLFDLVFFFRDFQVDFVEKLFDSVSQVEIGDPQVMRVSPAEIDRRLDGVILSFRDGQKQIYDHILSESDFGSFYQEGLYSLPGVRNGWF